MAIKTLPLPIRKFLEKLLSTYDDDFGVDSFTSGDQDTLRGLIDAASQTDTALALADKQTLNSVLTTFAAGTPGTALGDATAQANRRGMIGAASAVSPNFTSPTCVTPAEGDNSSLIASTAFVKTAIDNGVGAVLVLEINPNKGIMQIAGPLTTDGSTPATISDLTYAGVSNDYHWWSEDGTVNPAIGSIQWPILGIQPANGYIYDSVNVEWISPDPSAVEYPDDVAAPVFTPTAPATGEPALTAAPHPGLFTGQLCRAGMVAPYTWYRWDGTTWEDITTP